MALTVDIWNDPAMKASAITSQYRQWENTRTTAANFWKEIDSYIYSTDTNQLVGVEQNFDHTTHIPVVAELKDDLDALMFTTLFPHDDWLGWRMDHPDSIQKDKQLKVTNYVKNRFSLNGFREVMMKCVSDFDSYGNCFAQVSYVDETNANGEGYVGPRITRISPYDIVFNPAAKSFEKATPIIREVIDFGEFAHRASLDQNWNQEVVEEVLANRRTGTSSHISNTFKEQQYIPAGFTSIFEYLKSGFVEVLWFYGDVFDLETQTLHRDMCIGVVDGREILFELENVRSGIFHAGDILQPDNLWAMSSLSRVIGMNFQINHRENAKAHAMDRFIYPDKVLLGDVGPMFDDVTGAITYVGTENAQVSDIVPDTTVLTYNNEVAQYLSLARSAVRLPPQLAGFRSPGEKTLGEVNMLQEGAFKGIVNKAERFEISFLEPIVKEVLRQGNEHLDRALEIVTDTAEGVPNIISITKDDLDSSGTLVPYGARRFARDLQQFQTLNLLANSNLGALVGKHLDTFKLAESVERLGGFGKYEIFSRNRQIEESLEDQAQAAAAEQALAGTLAQPTAEELAIEEEAQILGL